MKLAFVFPLSKYGKVNKILYMWFKEQHLKGGATFGLFFLQQSHMD